MILGSRAPTLIFGIWISAGALATIFPETSTKNLQDTLGEIEMKDDLQVVELKKLWIWVIIHGGKYLEKKIPRNSIEFMNFFVWEFQSWIKNFSAWSPISRISYAQLSFIWKM